MAPLPVTIGVPPETTRSSWSLIKIVAGLISPLLAWQQRRLRQFPRQPDHLVHRHVYPHRPALGAPAEGAADQAPSAHRGRRRGNPPPRDPDRGRGTDGRLHGPPELGSRVP